jgi:hypothetical protein
VRRLNDERPALAIVCAEAALGHPAEGHCMKFVSVSLPLSR